MRRAGRSAVRAAHCLFVFLLLQPAGAGAEPPRASSRKCSIGVIASITGHAAQNGLNWLEGARFAAEELELGRQPCRLIIEDDATIPTKAVSSFVKLAVTDRVDAVVGGTWDFLAEAVAPFAERHKTTFITPTNPVEVMSKPVRGNQFFFTNGLSIAAALKPIRSFIGSRGVRSIGFVYIQVPYGVLHAEAVKALCAGLNIKTVLDAPITYEGFESVVKAAAGRILRDKPDLVFVVLNYEGVDLLLRELDLLKISVPVLMTHTLLEAYDFGRSPRRYEKAYGVYPLVRNGSFVERFSKRFRHPPYGYAAFGYDAVMFAAQAVRNGEGAGRPWRTAMEYEGASGIHRLPAKTIALTEAPAAIYAVRDGKLVLQEISSRRKIRVNIEKAD